MYENTSAKVVEKNLAIFWDLSNRSHEKKVVHLKIDTGDKKITHGQPRPPGSACATLEGEMMVRDRKSKSQKSTRSACPYGSCATALRVDFRFFDF